ncbi:MAG: YqjD family protein [Verrucomicrobiia bacterium]
MDQSSDNNAEQPAESVAHTAGEAAAAATQRVTESFDQGKQALVDMQSVLTERTRECLQSTEMYVRQNPWQAIGLAAGAGLVIGLLMGRR